MKIIVINGAPKSGKDTFVEFCHNYDPGTNNDIRVFNISTVDYIKSLARSIGWNGLKDEKGRRLLSDLKDSLTRYNDKPFYEVIKEIKNNLDTFNLFEVPTKDAIFFIHSREPEEIQKFVDMYDARTLIIRRPSQKEEEYSNHADANVEDYIYNYGVQNDGDLENLKKLANEFMEYILAKDWNSNKKFTLWDKLKYKESKDEGNDDWQYKLP